MLLNHCIYIYPVILILLFFTRIKTPVFAAGMHITLSQVPIFFISSLTGTFACLRMCKVLDRNKFLEFWGKKTLIVYCTHFWGLILIIPIIFNWFNPISPYSAILYYILIYLLEIVFCWLIIKLFSSKYLKWAIGSFQFCQCITNEDTDTIPFIKPSGINGQFMRKHKQGWVVC